MTDAAEVFAPDIDLDTDEQREHYRIGGDREATWALRKQWRAEREITRLKRNHADMVEALDQELERALAGPDRDRRFFDGLLSDYMRRLVEAGEADKTYRLPAGELTARKQPDTLDVTDADAFKDWAEGNGHLSLLRIKVEPDKKALAAHVKDTGEAVPGVVMRSGDVKFGAKPYDIGLVDAD